MIKDFLGIPFTRIGESARLWFRHDDIANHLHIGKTALWENMLESRAAPYRSLFADMRDLRIRLSKTPSPVKQNSQALFDVDYLLAAVFLMSSKDARKIRDWVAYQINSLCYDGFTALKPYSMPPVLRLAVTAKVCEVDHYLDIVRSRYDATDNARGTNKGVNDLEFKDLLNPDNYLKREEIRIVKAIDLAYTLLTTHLLKTEAQQEALLNLLEIDVLCGTITEDNLQDLSEWLRLAEEQHFPLEP